ncbi:MAG: protocatechuate 3,4-dioxygenase, partial [Chloroflexi bacterium]|nr:protocatechuate 3,4-dioxygenase [Chloroflexota bacterium]
MADLVLGIGSSHAPQLRMTAEQWPLLLHKDTNDPRYNYQEVLSRAKPDMEAEITPEVMEKRY